MRIIAASEARAHLAEVMNLVVADREPAVLTRNGGREPVVIVSLDDYQAMMAALAPTAAPPFSG